MFNLPNESVGFDIEKPDQLVKQFFSPIDYADYLEKIPKHLWSKSNDSARDDVRNAIKGMRNGDMYAACEAEKIINQLENEQIFADGLPQPEPQIVGGFTVTQLYNQGIPTCMLTYDNSYLKGVNTPLTIYFDAYGSIGLGSHLAMKRGVACLAFVMAVSKVRPVEMYIITCSSPVGYGLYGCLVKVPTNPLDLARVGFMMTDYKGYISHGRWAMMNWSYVRKNKSYQIYRNAIGPFGGGMAGEYIKEAYKEALKAKDDDIILYGTQTTAPRIHNVNAAHDPVGWVRAMLKLHRDKQ